MFKNQQTSLIQEPIFVNCLCCDQIKAHCTSADAAKCTGTSRRCTNTDGYAVGTSLLSIPAPSAPISTLAMSTWPITIGPSIHTFPFLHLAGSCKTFVYKMCRVIKDFLKNLSCLKVLKWLKIEIFQKFKLLSHYVCCFLKFYYKCWRKTWVFYY